MVLLCWFYFGLSINIKNLSGDIYTQGIIIYLLEGFAMVLGCYLVNFIGRKGMILLSGVVGLISLCFLSFLNLSDNSVNILNLITKLFWASAYNVLFLYTSELYPTQLRSAGYGFNLMIGYIGSMIFPILQEVYSKYIYIIYLVANVLFLITISFLPETNGMALKISITEENQSKELKSKEMELKEIKY